MREYPFLLFHSLPLFTCFSPISTRFHIFFHQLDNFKTDYFLWVTADGLDASYERTDRGLGEKPIPKALEAELGDEADGVEEVAN